MILLKMRVATMNVINVMYLNRIPTKEVKRCVKHADVKRPQSRSSTNATVETIVAVVSSDSMRSQRLFRTAAVRL